MMMSLSKKFLKEEIEKCKITIEQLKKGLNLNEFILKAFEDALICNS